MGRRGEEGVATEGEQIDCGRERLDHFMNRGLCVEMELIERLSLWPIRAPKTPHLALQRLHL